MAVVTNTTVRSNSKMSNLYYKSETKVIGCKTASFDQKVKNEDTRARGLNATETSLNSYEIYEQMACYNKSILMSHDDDLSNSNTFTPNAIPPNAIAPNAIAQKTITSNTITQGLTKVNEWPNKDTLKPAFITFNSGLTGYDTVEYFYDLSSDENNPTMLMRTKDGEEESFYKLDLNSINPVTATKAEMLGYYSYQEYKGEDVNMYQLMADMDMAEHNGYVSTSDNLKALFLECKVNWLKTLQDVLSIQKSAGDSRGATDTQGLLNYIDSTRN